MPRTGISVALVATHLPYLLAAVVMVLGARRARRAIEAVAREVESLRPETSPRRPP